MDDRPAIYVLVAWMKEPYGVIGWPKCMTLAEAEPYAQLGFVVWVDPWSLEEFTRWEQIQRSQTYKRKWFDRE